MRILRTNEVVALTGLSRSTIWRYQRDGIFPERIHLGPGAVGWLQTDIEQWVEARRAERKRTRPARPVEASAGA